MRFAQPLFLWMLLVMIPAAIGLLYWAWRVKQNLIRQFIRPRLLPFLTVGVSPRRQKFATVLIVLVLAATLLALARPQWGFVWEESKQKGLDIIIVLDTSRSMLAQDAAPNRLEKAKLAAFDLLRQAHNDRLGLVVFAGSAFLQSPLTLDDEAFRQGLEAVNVGIVPRGGTDISGAIKTAVASFEKNNDNHKVIVLFTDGEDHDIEAETLAAAKDAAEQGVHIFTVGVGTPEGELLRVKDSDGNYTFIKDDNGNAVKSRLNTKLLTQIATTANGFYLPLQGANPMETLYQRGLAPLPKGESTSRLTRTYREHYHLFLGFAVLCLLLEALMPENPRARRSESAPATRAALRKVAAVLCLFLATTAVRATPSAAFNDYRAGDYQGAFEEYNRLSQQNTNDYRLHYNAGTAAYRAKKLEEAEKQFNATLAAPAAVPDLTTKEHTFYNLGNTEFRLGEPLNDAEKKEQRWQQAIDSYTQALSLNTNDLDARNNLSYVQQRLEQLKQQQQQQQQQQNKNNKNQKNKNQKNQKGQQNKQQQQQHQKGEQQGEKSGEQGQQSGQQQQQKAQEQQSGQNQKSEEQQRQEAEARAKKEKEKEQQAQANSGEQNGQSKDEEQQGAAAGRLTQQEARQILAEDKDDERSLIFQPDQKEQPQTANRPIKDW